MKNGWLITVAILLPNLIYILFPPRDVPKEDNASGQKEKGFLKVMLLLERTGQIACSIIPFFYSLPLINHPPIMELSFMAVLLIIYYTCWARYVIQGRFYYLFYKPFVGIPLPMAISPSIFFLVASYSLKSIPLALASLCLTIGHIYISYMELKKGSVKHFV